MKLIDILIEQELGYSPEKLQEYITKGTNNVVIAKREYNKFLSIIKSLTINNVVNEVEKYEGISSQMDSIKNAIQKKYDQYYEVAERDTSDANHDATFKLERVADELQEYIYNFGDLIEILGNIIDAAKKLPAEEIPTIQQPQV